MRETWWGTKPAASRPAALAITLELVRRANSQASPQTWNQKLGWSPAVCVLTSLLTSGTMVKLVSSASVARGSQVWIPGTDLRTAHQAMLWQHPTYNLNRCNLRSLMQALIMLAFFFFKLARGQSILYIGKVAKSCVLRDVQRLLWLEISSPIIQ